MCIRDRALRVSLWHLGAALEGQGKNEDALSYYIKSYNAGLPDALRRAVIEKLYRRVNGSLEGLDERIGRSSNAEVSETTAAQTSTASPSPDVLAATPSPTPSPEVVTATPTPSPAPEIGIPSPSPSPTPSPEVVTATPTPSPEVKEESQPSPSPTPTPEAAPAPSPTPVAETPPAAAPVPESAEAPAKTPATFTVSGSVKDANDSALVNVVVVLISSQGTVLTTTTDERGNYSFTVAPSDHGYRIIPSRDGFTFAPADRLLPSVSGDVKEMNFIATPSPKP
jgi:hypothetical protein